LRLRDRGGDLREVEAVTELVSRSGFGSLAVVTMPISNLMLLFRRQR
jgi:hypothetical protein